MTQSIFEVGQIVDRTINRELNKFLDDHYSEEKDELQEHWSEGIDECHDWLRKAEDALLVQDFDMVRQCMAELVMHATDVIGSE